MAKRLRIGVIQYVNSIPLLYGMERLGDVVLDVPSGLARRFDAGELDVSFVPSVFYLSRLSKCHLVPGVSISSRGPTTSVLLCARTPLEQVRSVVRSPDSMTSNFLAQVILREAYRLEPAFLPHDHKGPAEAWLVIGDPALQKQDATICVDLGTEWLRLTGLPVVYAVCVANEPRLARAFAALVCRQTERNLDQLETVLASLGKSQWLDYLKGLDYGMTDDHVRSLERIAGFLAQPRR